MANRQDLERWYDEHARAVFALLLNLVRNESDARDLLQEVFVRLANQPERFNAAEDPRAYALRLAHNAAVDLFRRRSRRHEREEAWEAECRSLFAPTEDPDEAAFRNALNEALAELPTEQRAVVHLKLWEGRTFDEIAQMLAIPLNTAASRYRYAVDKLRSRLRPLYEELR